MCAKRILATLTLTTMLAACGGNNSSPPASTQTPPPPPTPSQPEPEPNYDTEEYRLNPGLDEINAIAAYENGYTGESVTIALMDSGIDDEHPDLINQIHPASKDFGGNGGGLFDDTKYDLSQNSNIVTSVIHGTMTAGIMVAEKNEQGMHGVAYDAQVLALRMELPEIASWGGKDINLAAVPDAIDHAIANDAKILMVEWAFWDETANEYAGPDNQISSEFMVGDELMQPIKDAFQRAIDANMLIVIPSGNEFGTAPTAFTSQMGLDENNENAVVVVGATDREQVIYDRSNKAGYAQDYFVVAPSRVTTTAPTRGIGEGRSPWTNSSNGTSFAGPHVAGAAAVLMQAFPNLTAREIADILFMTATDLGDTGVDDIYGRGLINLEAAIQPIGQPQSRTRSGTPLSFESNFTSVSPAFGDALGNVAGLDNIIALDNYKRAYRFDLSRSMHIRSNSPNLSSRLDSYTDLGHSTLNVEGMGNIGFSYLAPGKRNEHLADSLPFAATSNTAAASNVQFSFSRNLDATTNIGFIAGDGGSSLFTENTPAQHRSIQATNPHKDAYATLFTGARGVAFGRTYNDSISYGFAFSQYENRANTSSTPLLFNEPSEAVAVNTHVTWEEAGWKASMQLGSLKERGSFLGTRSSGAFSFADNSRTTYTSLYATKSLGKGWELAGRYTLGFSDIGKGANSFIEDVSTIRTTSFMGQITKAGLLQDSDRLSITFSQPLRVSGGTLTAYLPTAQNISTSELEYAEIVSSLSPRNRELDFELMYQLMTPTKGLSLQANALYQQNPGHIKGSAGAFLLRANMKF